MVEFGEPPEHEYENFKRFRKLLGMVKPMRAAQRSYYLTKSMNALKQAQQQEKVLDEYLESLEKPDEGKLF